MALPNSNLKMVGVESNLFESVGYIDSTREMYIKFKNSPMLCIADVPRFRFNGLMTAPRKDAYYTTYIKDRFLAKPVA
jgi:hypothetical protein